MSRFVPVDRQTGYRDRAGRGIQLSMDGNGSWRDNVFVERVWRSIKYEEVYLKAYESVSHARRSIGEYIELYNQRRPHASAMRTRYDVELLKKLWSCTASSSINCNA